MSTDEYVEIPIMRSVHNLGNSKDSEYCEIENIKIKITDLKNALELVNASIPSQIKTAPNDKKVPLRNAMEVANRAYEDGVYRERERCLEAIEQVRQARLEMFGQPVHHICNDISTIIKCRNTSRNINEDIANGR